MDKTRVTKWCEMQVCPCYDTTSGVCAWVASSLSTLFAWGPSGLTAVPSLWHRLVAEASAVYFLPARTAALLPCALACTRACPAATWGTAHSRTSTRVPSGTLPSFFIAAVVSVACLPASGHGAHRNKRKRRDRRGGGDASRGGAGPGAEAQTRARSGAQPQLRGRNDARPCRPARAAAENWRLLLVKTRPRHRNRAAWRRKNEGGLRMDFWATLGGGGSRGLGFSRVGRGRDEPLARSVFGSSRTTFRERSGLEEESLRRSQAAPLCARYGGGCLIDWSIMATKRCAGGE